MDTNKLIKILRCGDASHDEQEQAADKIEQLRTALRLLFEECVLSGNASARDYGWPKALSAARAALNPTP